MSDTQRNFLILAAITVAGVAIGGAFDTTLFTLSMLVSIGLMIAIGFLMWTWHRNNAARISAMKTPDRLLLQSSGIMLFAIFLTGTVFPGWSMLGGVYTLMFFVMIAACVFAIYTAWQRRPY